MEKRLFFVSNAAAGYGARVYLSQDGDHFSREAHSALKFISHWGGSDKTWKNSLGTVYLGYEMTQEMADTFANLLELKGFNREVSFQK